MAIWLRIFCAALLLSLGFAHKPLYAQRSPDPASSYYALPNGSFAGLCIDGVDRGKPGKSGIASGCDVCRLTPGTSLPAPSADGAAMFRNDRRIEFPSDAAPFDQTLERPGSPVRGPPSIFA